MKLNASLRAANYGEQQKRSSGITLLIVLLVSLRISHNLMTQRQALPLVPLRVYDPISFFNIFIYKCNDMRDGGGSSIHGYGTSRSILFAIKFSRYFIALSVINCLRPSFTPLPL